MKILWVAPEISFQSSVTNYIVVMWEKHSHNALKQMWHFYAVYYNNIYILVTDLPTKYIFWCVCVCVCVCVYIYTHTHTHTYIYIHTHTHTHTHAHTHTHTHTHIHTHTHTLCIYIVMPLKINRVCQMGALY